MAIVATYQYRTVAGESVTVERHEPGWSGKGKDFRHLPEGIEGPFLHYTHDRMPPDGTIVITEGEKDCLKLWEMGYASTTFRGGGGGWRGTLWEFCRARDIIITPDKDKTGRAMCEGLAAHLLNGVGAARVSVVRVKKEWPDHFNACDLPEDELRAALDDPEEVRPETPVLWTPRTVTRFADVRMPPMMVPGLMEIGSPTIIFGKPDTGKSTYAILAALALMTGRGDLIGLKSPLEPMPCGFIWAEEGWNVLDAKLSALMEKHGIPDSETKGRIFDLTDGEGNEWKGNLAVDAQVPPIRDMAVKAGVRAIFIDSLSRVAPEAETQNDFASKTATALSEICRAINGSMLIVHHSRKALASGETVIGLEEARGASAVYATSRIVLQVEKTDIFLDEDSRDRMRRAHTVKANNFLSPKPLAFRTAAMRTPSGDYVPYAMLVDETQVSGPFSPYPRADVIRAWYELCEAPDDRRRQSPKSPGYAGKTLARSLSIDMTHQPNRARVKAMLSEWMDNGHLDGSTIKSQGQDRKIYVRGDISLADPEDL